MEATECSAETKALSSSHTRNRAVLSKRRGTKSGPIRIDGPKTGESDKQRAKEVGFDHHHTEPVALTDLTRVLASVSAT